MYQDKKLIFHIHYKQICMKQKQMCHKVRMNESRTARLFSYFCKNATNFINEI